MERKNPANLFVCDCITKALFKLMKKKEYHNIKISELVNTAGVSRNSFYRNYQSTEEILREYLVLKTTEWWSNFMRHPEKYSHVISEMFQHFLNMKEEIDLIYQAGLFYLLLEHIFHFSKESLNGEIQNVYKTAFLSGGLWGLINEWVLRGMKETPDEMEQFFLNQTQDLNNT